LTGSASAAPAAVIDPEKFTIQQVLAHVDAHPEQRAAILAAEIEGKNRKSLVEALSTL
jgi:hypothetical protein